AGFFGGMAFESKAEVDDKSSFRLNYEDLKLDNGITFGAKVGYLIPNRILGIELEYSYIGNINVKDQDAFTYAGNSYKVQADMYTSNIFLNLLLRYPESSFHPFIGAGFGMSWIEVKDAKVNPTLPGYPITNAGNSTHDNCLAYQVFLGLEYDISPGITLTGTYKYFHVEPSFADILVDAKIRSNLVTLGMNFSF
ncbi:MAG TPA: outer membrane beta-barrel protein, partial [Syntrophales bacterium]|nr:outer membrane beta-barrel protein [Syntrophales bacterium]